MRRWLYIAAAAVTAAFGVLVWQLDLPNWQRLDLEKIQKLPESTVVFTADGQRAGTLCAERERRYQPLNEIPEHVISAFLTAEDQRFYSHSGVDIRRIFAALLHDIKTGSFEQGASTITQQLIKLTHLSSEKTLSRKLQEVVLAVQLEKKLGKDEILEAYLNTVYFGSGAYGIGSAAQVYFGKNAQNLTVAQAALLAGVIKSPSRYAPHLHPQSSLDRRNRILGSMHENSEITEEEYRQAIAEPLTLAPQQASGDFGWYMDQVMLEAEQILHMDAEEILSSGLHIHTGLNPALQSIADELFANGANFPDPAADGTAVQAALAALDTASGEIRAIVGGREHLVQRGFNRASQMQRQPGSAIKPISSYAAAIQDKGFLPVSTVQDVQREFPGKYLPGNAGGAYYGTVTLREALSRSLNVATVDLADLIGMHAVRSAIEKFGIPLAHQDVNLSLSLGSMTYGVSPAKLCAAYCALANGGMRVEPHAIRRITDRRGHILYEAPAAKERAVSEETAFLITDMLKTAAGEGSAKALADAGIPVMGKTGTVGEAGGGNRDIWTVACTPELALAVWMGFDEPDSSHAMPDYAGGSSYPARLCAAFLAKSASYLSGSDFKAPDTLVSLPIDRLALTEYSQPLLAAVNTPKEYIRHEWFPENRQPAEISPLWNAPEAVDDLTLLSDDAGAPSLAFTCKESGADYLVLRRSGSDTQLSAVLSGKAGDIIIWTDPEPLESYALEYSVLPRHRLLYECGVLLTGTQSSPVTYTSGGFLSRLFG